MLIWWSRPSVIVTGLGITVVSANEKVLYTHSVSIRVLNTVYIFSIANLLQCHGRLYESWNPDSYLEAFSFTLRPEPKIEGGSVSQGNLPCETEVLFRRERIRMNLCTHPFEFYRACASYDIKRQTSCLKPVTHLPGDFICRSRRSAYKIADICRVRYRRLNSPTFAKCAR